MTELVARRDTARLYEASIAIHGSQTASGVLDEAAFDRVQQKSIDAYDELAASLRPWEGVSKHDRRKRVLDVRLEEFHRFFGKAGSKQYEDHCDKIIAKLKEEDVEVPDDEEVMIAAWRAGSNRD